MSMDLAAFVSGTEPWALWERLPNHEEFGPPPSVTIKRGATYVETYIKMFYFPLEVCRRRCQRDAYVHVVVLT